MDPLESPPESPPDSDLFLREDEPADGAAGAEPWLVLVVDDDEQVHAMTRVLLGDFRFEDRPFAMISAFSAAEARAILAERPDVPVMLLDVVMEAQDSGLELVHHIRRDLGNQRIRIILRTGQPGQAPERDVIIAYDINDYKAKSELTSQKLFTSLVGALRAWRDIATIEQLNQSLERRVAERTAELARQQAQAEEQRRFVEHLIEMMPSPVWYEDAQGRRVLSNRAFRDLFPQAPAQDGAQDTESEAGTVPIGQGRWVPAMDPSSTVFETSVTAPGGFTRELLVVRKALPTEEGSPQGSIGIATDITARRLMERELHRLAITDALSGVHNRRHLLGILAGAVADVASGAAAGADPCSLVMLDIDHFKRINDEHGHAAGDRTIEFVAAEIREHLRGTDSIGRIGGEEFAILLPGAALKAAGAIAERIRAGIAASPIPLPDGRFHPTTASFGVTELRPGQDSVEAVLHRADEALYRAKANGRNRIEFN
ncbi:GGDEF domain-containing response regulator [Azospirillum rugosum]|uniref:diguanylate cyclase n=1 Tax=Azospirillum rugosum TaxID=416170 RepID=A0ABS4SM60_9PROT|nr:diguanylate cyclase [Azospirillum rugosum]MBP2293655.1 diguanylate cyclase (GGDEF)-like protein [Azospirillum rugosum]MDQ0527200.1 diguanylate cyclase (GGDEF)-like protein [Azospirillum rugosum]